MIVYFTGTGNSRLIANILAKALGDRTFDAAAAIRAGETPQLQSDRPWVFVAPVYAWRLPRIFEEWIRACQLRGDRRACLVLTCGSSIGAAGDHWAALCRDLGLEPMGTAPVVMPENYIAMFRAPGAEKAAAIIGEARKTAGALAEQIRRGQPFPEKKQGPVGKLSSGLVNDCFYNFFIGAKKFRATEACIGCGKCAQVCMLRNITLRDGKPVWGSACTHCMACINRCPAAAIEYGRHTKGLRRYVCPEEE